MFDFRNDNAGTTVKQGTVIGPRTLRRLPVPNSPLAGKLRWMQALAIANRCSIGELDTDDWGRSLPGLKIAALIIF